MITVPSWRSTRAPLLVGTPFLQGERIDTEPSPEGVLDSEPDEPWLQIEGISGTSAGAMNTAVVVDGHAEEEQTVPERGSSAFGSGSPTALGSEPSRRSPLDILLGRWTLGPYVTSAASLYQPHGSVFSPYDLDPHGGYWQTASISKHKRGAIKLFVLPTMFQAIEIDGEAYWDGGNLAG